MKQKKKKLTYNELLNAVNGRCAQIESVLRQTMDVVDRTYIVLNEYIEYKHDSPKFTEHFKVQMDKRKKEYEENKKDDKKATSVEK